MPFVFYGTAIGTSFHRTTLAPFRSPATLLGGTTFFRNCLVSSALRPLGAFSVKLSAFKSLGHLISYGEKICKLMGYKFI
jgi:hypothetical protein